LDLKVVFCGLKIQLTNRELSFSTISHANGTNLVPEDRNLEEEIGALLLFREDPDLSVHLLKDHLANIKAKAHPILVDILGLSDLAEELEEVLKVGSRYADTGVDDLSHELADLVHKDPDSDGALEGEF
jgi:hypothetical protein